GLAALQRRDAQGARAYFARAAKLDPEDAGPHNMVANIDLPGPNYMELLRRIHEELRPRSYIEIGVASGKSFSLALPQTRSIGVDPKPQLIVTLGANATVYEMTSDEFFARHDVRGKLGGPIELAFIDGMHHFEFALRDFINIEKSCTPDSTVLFHDAYPLDR